MVWRKKYRVSRKKYERTAALKQKQKIITTTKIVTSSQSETSIK